MHNTRKEQVAGPRRCAGPTQPPSSRLHYIQGQAQRSLEKCSPQSTENTPSDPRQLKTPPHGLWHLSQPHIGVTGQGLLWPPLCSKHSEKSSPLGLPQLPFYWAPVSVLAPTVWGRHRHSAIWPAGGGEGWGLGQLGCPEHWGVGAR